MMATSRVCCTGSERVSAMIYVNIQHIFPSMRSAVRADLCATLYCSFTLSHSRMPWIHRPLYQRPRPQSRFLLVASATEARHPVPSMYGQASSAAPLTLKTHLLPSISRLIESIFRYCCTPVILVPAPASHVVLIILAKASIHRSVV